MYQVILQFEPALRLEEAESPAPGSWKDPSLLYSASFSMEKKKKGDNTTSVY